LLGLRATIVKLASEFMRMNAPPTLISAREFVEVHTYSDGVRGWFSLAAVLWLVALGATDTSPDMYCKNAIRCGARPGGILTCPVADTVSARNTNIAGGSSFLTCLELRDITLSSYKNIS